MVSLPFVSSDFAEGELPPADFAEDRTGAATFYSLLDNITRDDYVLVAFEYGPAAAGELDLLAELLLRHIFAQRATPLIVSSNPIAVVHARNIIREINLSILDADARLAANEDYYLLRYLPGGALGLRELSENFADVARVTARGQLSGLELTSLEDMLLTLLITESADDVRHWVEQVLPEVDGMDLLVATGYAAQPLAQAYVDSVEDVVGPVYGIRDAFTYGEKLRVNFGGLGSVELEQEPEVEPAALSGAPDSGPEDNDGRDAQAERAPATVAPADTALPEATAASAATETPQPTSTTMPTDTPAPTATDTPAPTATEASLLAVEITSPQRVNIRRGPTTVDDVLALGYPGDLYEVLGANGDSSWYEIALDNGLEGWVAAFLVEERLVTASELAGDGTTASASAPRERAVMRLDFSLRLGKNERRFFQVSSPDAGDRPELVLLRDRRQEIPRLQAMTLGTLAAVLIIVIGNLLYAVRGLLRRGAPGA